MSRQRSYTDEDLSRAIAASRSWRGVLRTLGLKATSASAMRSARAHADRLGLDYSHFTGQRRWTDADLAEAVGSALSWTDVATRLGLTGGSSHITLKGHALRLGIPTEHLGGGSRARPVSGSTPPLHASLAHLPRAGSLLAASWFTLCGHEVSWPVEPAVYDLVVRMDGGFQRVQVKTTSVRAGDAWVVRLTRSGKWPNPYDPDEIDFFFVIDGDLTYYLIPIGLVGGLSGIHLTVYSDFRLDRTLALG